MPDLTQPAAVFTVRPVPTGSRQVLIGKHVVVDWQRRAAGVRVWFELFGEQISRLPALKCPVLRHTEIEPDTSNTQCRGPSRHSFDGGHDEQLVVRQEYSLSFWRSSRI